LDSKCIYCNKNEGLLKVACARRITIANISETVQDSDIVTMDG